MHVEFSPDSADSKFTAHLESGQKYIGDVPKVLGQNWAVRHSSEEGRVTFFGRCPLSDHQFLIVSNRLDEAAGGAIRYKAGLYTNEAPDSSPQSLVDAAEFLSPPKIQQRFTEALHENLGDQSKAAFKVTKDLKLNVPLLDKGKTPVTDEERWAVTYFLSLLESIPTATGKECPIALHSPTPTTLYASIGLDKLATGFAGRPLHAASHFVQESHSLALLLGKAARAEKSIKHIRQDRFIGKYQANTPTHPVGHRQGKCTWGTYSEFFNKHRKFAYSYVYDPAPDTLSVSCPIASSLILKSDGETVDRDYESVSRELRPYFLKLQKGVGADTALVGSRSGYLELHSDSVYRLVYSIEKPLAHDPKVILPAINTFLIGAQRVAGKINTKDMKMYGRYTPAENLSDVLDEQPAGRPAQLPEFEAARP